MTDHQKCSVPGCAVHREVSLFNPAKIGWLCAWHASKAKPPHAASTPQAFVPKVVNRIGEAPDAPDANVGGHPPQPRE